eukprot:TRINITY_DN8262_c0_g1_i1.p1 TRINITY_DN8262_c0_g1~~TRINITY_DN8262_c0_g1_i1.p1  ORF type:complete len:419 (-),score=56.20 TRINITY_DN8262_c0_g1_i1:124-1380(-)
MLHRGEGKDFKTIRCQLEKLRDGFRYTKLIEYNQNSFSRTILTYFNAGRISSGQVCQVLCYIGVKEKILKLLGANWKNQEMVLNPAEELNNHPHYEFVKPLNSGASVERFALCKKRADGSEVVIKLLPRGKTSISKYVVRGIMNHRLLQHDHIIRYKDISLTKSCMALAMEYANAGSLFDYVIKNQGLQESKARWFFQQLIIAVDYCHRRGVSARNIKLENILLHQINNDRLILKIRSLGYYKIFGNFELPQYLAPELIKQKKGENCDAFKADIWSCGVCLYVLLTACFPFERADDKLEDAQGRLQIMLERIDKGDFVVPKDLNLSEEVKWSLNGILEPDPEKRLTIDQIFQHPWFVVGLPSGVLEWNQKMLKKKPVLDQTDDEVLNIVVYARENVVVDDDEDEESPHKVRKTLLREL